MALSVPSITTTGESWAGSPTKVRFCPRTMGTSAQALSHWLASSMTTMSKLGTGCPNLCAEMQVVATMGKIRRNFLRLSVSER